MKQPIRIKKFLDRWERMTLEQERPSESHRRRVLEHLMTGATITPKEAWLRYGCYRLGARIYDLRKMGYNIENINKHKSERYAEYLLKKENENTSNT
jgi:hypothetical protein